MIKLKTAVGLMFCVFFACSVFYIMSNAGKISYYATFENGNTVKVDNIVAVPIWSVEQIDKIWPEYYAETKISVDGKEIILRSKPFLFCDNPEMEGNYAGRDVYYSLAGRR